MNTPWYQGFASVLPKFVKPDPDCPARGYKKIPKYTGREVTELQFRQEDVCVLSDPNGAFVYFYKPRKQMIFPNEMSQQQQPGGASDVEREFGNQRGSSWQPTSNMGGHAGHHH
jgi:hypothetical protein